MENNIKPYGDSLNDGLVQLSFTLPVAYNAKAKKAAEVYVSRLNFEDVSVVHSQKISEGFTYFIVFAKAIPELDYSTIEVQELKIREMGFDEINGRIKKELNRPLSVIGASIESDAHTVGIDAIMNMKGFKQNYGLERYPMITSHNMGAHVSCEALIEKAQELEVDAILVSQTVTKNDIHVQQLKSFIAAIDETGLKNKFLLVAGGARISNEFALSLGYDAGFGRDTFPSQVASFLAERIIERKKTDGS